MIRPEAKPIPNEEDVHASSNSRCSFPSRRSPTDSAGSGPSTCRTASGPADAYAALTDAGSFAAARTVPGTGEDLVAEEIKDRRKGAVAIATHYRWVITALDLAFF
jgi:hypothetical protein